GRGWARASWDGPLAVAKTGHQREHLRRSLDLEQHHGVEVEGLGDGTHRGVGKWLGPARPETCCQPCQRDIVGPTPIDVSQGSEHTRVAINHLAPGDEVEPAMAAMLAQDRDI